MRQNTDGAQNMNTYRRVLLLVVFLATGCASWQPSSGSRPTDVKLPWNDYKETQAAVAKIQEGKTTLEQLKALGFDPITIPNTEKIVDVRNALLSTPTSTISELPELAQACYRNFTMCDGYNFTVRVVDKRGVGNTALRLAGVKKKVLTTGWWFSLKVFLVEGNKLGSQISSDLQNQKVVVFWLFGGVGNVQSIDTEKRPLGPINTILGVGSKISPYPAPNLRTD